MSDASLNSLTSQALTSLAAHAREEYPLECCGFVFADGTVHRATNIQSQLANEQPGRYSRTAANGYTLSLADTVTLDASFSSENPAVILYHSHPDVGSYFSREDKDKALFAGTPIYPLDYLVIDARASDIREAKLFAWDGDDFTCVKTLPLYSSIPGSQ